MEEHYIPDSGILKFMLFGEEFWSVLECTLTLFPFPNISAHSFTVQTGIFNLGTNELYDRYWERGGVGWALASDFSYASFFFPPVK